MIFVNFSDFAYVKLFISFRFAFNAEKKKLFLNICTFSSNVVARTSFRRSFERRDIFLIIDFFFAYLTSFYISFFEITSTMFFLNFVCLIFLIVFFFLSLFWHIFVNLFSNNFLFIFVVIFEIRESLRNNFEIKTTCFRCLFLFMKLFCLLFRLNNFVTF